MMHNQRPHRTSSAGEGSSGGAERRNVRGSSAFLDAVLGDLAEEYAMRAARDGATAARSWYLYELVRSLPHIVANAVVHLVLHGSREARLRAVLWIGGTCASASLLAVWFLSRGGPPVRLEIAGSSAHGLVVNHRRALRLPIRVLDEKGHALASNEVQFERIAGIPVQVTAQGVITCSAHGNAEVRATLGALSTRFVVDCQPIRTIKAAIWNDFVLGEPSRELPLDIVGFNDAPVRILAARLRVDDSSVATMRGLQIVPRAPGRAHIDLQVGDRYAGAAIRVFAPVQSLEGLRDDQRLVAVPIRLMPGSTRRWELPEGLLSVLFLPDRTDAPFVRPVAPLLAVSGPVMCLPTLGPRVYNAQCLVRGPGAVLTASHPGASMATVAGHVALDRLRE